jgi:formiminotetrahydrofolate cyclodeaminase
MSNFVDDTVRGFNDALASKEPAPGGGSASAHAVAQAAGLLCMYCRLTTGRKKFAAVEEKMNDAIKELERGRARLLELIDLDARAYTGVMNGYALPKDTDAQKAARTEAIQAALKEAATVPMEVCTWAVRLLEVAQVVHKDGNPNGLTDAGVGVQLAMAGFAGAALNVYVNLGTIKDETFVVSFQKTVHGLEASARNLSMEIAGYIFEQLNVNG